MAESKPDSSLSLATVPAGTSDFIGLKGPEKSQHVKDTATSLSNEMQRILNAKDKSTTIQLLKDSEERVEQLLGIMMMLDSTAAETSMPKSLIASAKNYTVELEKFLFGTIKTFKDIDSEVVKPLEWRQLNRDVVDARSILENILSHL